MRKALAVIFFVTLIPTISFADEKKEAGSGPNPYIDCGIGSVFDNKYGASSSNVIWDLGSTAITSAVSSPENCKKGKVETSRLILETLPDLEKDVALGRGKYLSALTEVMDCDSSLNGQFNDNLRRLYTDVVFDKAYGNKSIIQRATDMYNSVKRATLSMPGSCKVSL